MLRRVGYVLLGLLALVAAAFAALATPPGRALVENTIEGAVSSADMTLDIQGLSGFLPFAAHIDRVTIADADGVFLEVEGARASWSPGRIVFGEIVLPEVSVERVALTRQPRFAPAPASASAEPTRLPPLALGRLSVAQVELGAPVIGQAAVLTVDASAKLSPDGAVSARASVNRIDSRQLKLTAEVEKPAGGIGTATIDLTEAEDGLLVTALGQASGPAYQLGLTVRDPPSGPEGTLTLSSGARDQLNGRFALAAQPVGHRLTGSLEGLLADLVPAAVADLVAGPIAGTVDLSIQSASDITIHAGSIQSGALALSVSGQLGGAGDALKGQLVIKRADQKPIQMGAPHAVAVIEALEATLAIAPNGTTSRLDVTGHARGLTANTTTVPRLGLSIAAEAVGRRFLDPGPLPFAARLEADQIITPLGTLAADAKAPLIARVEGDATPADGQGALVTLMAIDAAGGQLAFTGQARASGVEGLASVRLPNIAALAALIGPAYSGSMAASAEGLLFAPGPRVEAVVSVEGQDVRVGQAAVDGLLKGTLAGSGTVSLASDGSVAWRNGIFKTAALIVRSTGQVSADQLAGSIKASLTDLAAVAPGARGAVTLEATARGSLAAPQLEGAIGVAAGEIGGRALQDAAVRFTVSPGEAGPRGALTLSGRYAERPLTGGVDVERRATGFTAPKIDLAIGQTTIKGALAQRVDGQIDGRLVVVAPQVAELAALAFVEARGALQADVSFVPGAAATDQRLDFGLKGQDVAVAGVGIETIEADGAVTGLTGTPAVNATAKVRRVNASGVSIDSIDATARDDGTTTRFDIKAAGRDLSGQVAGGLTRAADGFTLEVGQGAVKAFGIDTRLAAPLVVARTAEGTVLKSARLSLGGGTVAASGPLEPALNVEVALSGLPAAFLNRFAPELGAEGRLEGKLTAKNTLADPRLSWTANWADMSLAAMKAAKLPAFLISARGDATKASTTLDARIVGAGLNFAVGGRLPVGAGPLDLKANGRVPMALLGASLGREVRAAGGADVAVAIGGSAAKPTINGTATLVGVEVSDALTNVGVSGVTGAIRFDGTTATVDGVTGRLAQGGRFTLAGPVQVDPARGLPANLRLTVVDGVYADGTLVRANFGAVLSLEGPLMGNALASGQVDLGRVEVTLPDRLPSSAANLSITHQNAGSKPETAPAARPAPRRAAPARRAAPDSRPIRLDIAVAARQGVFVRGFGLDAELGGSVRVRGTVIDPTIEGGFDMRRGRFEILARRFDFSRGRVTFAGDMMPELDFVASTKTTDATVSVVVNGSAQAPSFSFQSTPSLPAEEVVSRLLFDRGIGKLSTVQVVRLVDELGKLSGVTKSGIFDSLRRTFGLTDLDVKQDEKGNVAVGIGGQVTDRVRVGVEQGTLPGSGKVIVDVDVIQNLLKGRGEVGANGKGKVGITVEREY